MIGHLPLAVVQLLIGCIEALETTSNNETTAMAPDLHLYPGTILALGNQQDPILILGHISRHASRAFRSWSICPAFCVAVRVYARGPRRGARRWAERHAYVLSPWVGFLERAEVEGRLEDGIYVVPVMS